MEQEIRAVLEDVELADARFAELTGVPEIEFMFDTSPLLEGERSHGGMCPRVAAGCVGVLRQVETFPLIVWECCECRNRWSNAGDEL